MKTVVNTTLIGFLCLVSMPARADDAADDKMRLQGVWVLSSGEANGQQLGEVLRKKGLDGLKIKFSGNVMTMTGFGAPRLHLSIHSYSDGSSKSNSIGHR